MSETVEIEKITAGGDGLGHLKNGKIVFIPNTAPGDIAEFDVISENRGFIRGSVKKIIVWSSARRQPPCPYYASCGGCNLMHINYEDQLQIKRRIVSEVFLRIGKIGLNNLTIIPSKSEFHYKNRMQFHTDRMGKTGLRRRGDNEIIEINRCMIAAEPINNWLNETGTGSNKGKTSLFATNNGSIYTDMEKTDIPVIIEKKTILTSSTLFFQTNLMMLPEFTSYVTDGLKGVNALDMYCGVGMFASYLQESHRYVTGVESCLAAEPYFQKNAGKEAVFIGKPVEKAVKQLDSWKWDTAVIDPPRRGLSETARNILMKLKPEKCVYVSCDPVTQARDMYHLILNGYVIEEIRLFDFYPQTSHIESVVKLKYNVNVGNDKKHRPDG